MNPPKRGPMDGDKYRENYLANLTLQAANNQKNQNANLILKSTGQTPNQPTDNRTTTERMADQEGVKQEVRSFLQSAGFCNSTVAYNVAQDLEEDEREFVLRYKLFIATDFKGRNSPGPVLLAYLRKLKRKTEETRGVDYGLQQHTGEGILLSNTQILHNMVGKQDIEQLAQLIGQIEASLGNVGPNSSITAMLLNRINSQLATIETLIPTAADLERIRELPLPTQEPIQRRMSELFEDFPSRSVLQQDINRLDTAVRANDIPAINQALRPILSDVSVSQGQLDMADDIGRNLARAVEEKERDDEATDIRTAAGPPPPISVPGSGEQSFFSRVMEGAKKAFKSPRVAIEPQKESTNLQPLQEEETRFASYNKPEKVAEKVAEKAEKKPTPKKAGYVIDSSSKPEDINALPNVGYKMKLVDFLRPRLSTLKANGGAQTIRDLNDADIDELKRQFNIWYQNAKVEKEPVPISSASTTQETQFGSVEGHGLKKMKAKPIVLKGSGLAVKHEYSHIKAGHIEGEYEKPKPYKQFGKYLINKHKLDDNIVMIHRPSGVALKELPTHKCSTSVAKILKQVVGGMTPAYEHFEGLGVADREHLHKICHICRVEGMPSLKGSKSNEEKENDRFEILKGEILAGNDNKHLIREFKVLLMRFLHAGRIPRREAHEILTDLTSMGF